MLGITIPDSIAFGSLCAALLAAWGGLVKGDRAKKETPPEPGLAMIGSALVDRATLQDLTEAVRDVASALRAGITAGEVRSRDDLAGQIRDLVERIDHRPARR